MLASLALISGEIMARYCGKEVVYVYCIDYSANNDGFVCYEIQHFLSSNYETNDPSVSDEKKLLQSSLWRQFFQQISESVFLVDLPPVFDQNKYTQRRLFSTRAETSVLTPPHLRCNQETTIEAILAFYAEHDHFVFKGVGALGRGNQFFKKTMEDNHPRVASDKDAFLAIFKRYQEKERHGFVVEKTVMFPPLNMDAFNPNEKPGAHYRDLVFYYSEQKTVRSFEVYSDVIRTSVTFDSHAKEVFLSEENHLLENDPHKLLNEMQRREALYPGLYVLKRNAFIAIGQSIERYCLTTASVLNPNRGKNRTNFLRVFHDKDCHYYDAFFRYCCQKCFGVARDGNHCALFLPPSLDEYDHLLMRMRKAMGWFSSYDKESQAALSDLLEAGLNSLTIMQLYAVHHVLSEDEFRFEESIEARLRVLIDARIHALETEEKALVASNP